MAENNNGVQVSIICTAYNHAKYIRQCLDGFVMQKGVSFEIIIHDDASTDGTADIIREYEAKYPQLFKPIYQTENQHSQHIPFTKLYMIPKVTGKYVALCEGDDFWVDEYKLKKQYDALESNPDCYMCLHKVKVVKEDGVTWDGRYTPYYDFPTMKITSELYFQYHSKARYFQTSSYFINAMIWKDYILNPPQFRKVAAVGDLPLLLYFAYLGNIYYYDEIMSHYRYMSSGSFNERMKNDPKMVEKHYDAEIKTIESFNEFSNNKYAIQLQYYIDSYIQGKKVLFEDKLYNLISSKNYNVLFSEYDRDVLLTHGFTRKAILKIKLQLSATKIKSFFNRKGG